MLLDDDDMDELGEELAHGDGDAAGLAGLASTVAREEATTSAPSTKKIRNLLCIDFLPAFAPFPNRRATKRNGPLLAQWAVKQRSCGEAKR